MGSNRFYIRVSQLGDDGPGILAYLLGMAAGVCFILSMSLYCDWPFSHEVASRWVTQVRTRVRVELHSRLFPHEPLTKTEGTVNAQWAQLELQFSLVQSFLTEDNCKQNRKNLAACVAVVNRLLDYSDMSSEFVPGSSSTIAHVFRQEIADFGFAHIRKRESNLGTDLRLVVEQDKKMRQDRELEWSRMRLLNDDMPFEKVARWLKYELVDVGNESELTGVAYNTYLSVARDPHSQIIPMTLYKTFFGQGTKQFSGFGVDFQRLGDNVFVYEVVDGTPAQRVGLQPYDLLVEVNDTAVAGLSMREILDEIRFAEPVKLKISRAGKELVFNITKVQNLPMHDVVSTLLGADQSIVGYIKVARFATGVCKTVKGALEYFNHNDVQSVVLDLRNNTGGDLGEGICLTSLFLAKGSPIVRIENLLGANQDRLFHAPADPTTTLPLYVLVNSRTASASEIFAGVIQEYHRGLILGQRTFGKGTTQVGRSWSRNPNDPASKKFIYLSTVGRFLLPSGYSIQIHGVQPDIAAFGNPWPTEYDQFAIREEDHPSYVEPTERPEHIMNPELANRLAACKSAQDQAGERFDQLQRAGMYPDYPLISAQYWSRCLNQGPNPVQVNAASAMH
jgi:carboxyl-terminal processing protease